jgi:hypothetical protein
MAKNTASQSLLLKAEQDVRRCAAYLKKHFASPKNQSEIEAKDLAQRTLASLAKASENRDPDKIKRRSKSLSKVMVYLWMLRQFPDHGSSHEQKHE